MACVLLVRDVRRAVNRALLSTLFVFPLVAGAPSGAPIDTPSAVTVVLDFTAAYSDQSVREMQREAQSILHASGIHLEWRTRSQASRASFDELVVIKFSGACEPQATPWVSAEPGSLGYTFVSDGSVLPYSEIACDKVAAAIRSAMPGGVSGDPEMLLGRALGRVVAHELVHMLTASRQHGREGVHRAELSGRQLVAIAFPLSAADTARLQHRGKPAHAPETLDPKRASGGFCATGRK